ALDVKPASPADEDADADAARLAGAQVPHVGVPLGAERVEALAVAVIRRHDLLEGRRPERPGGSLDRGDAAARAAGAARAQKQARACESNASRPPKEGQHRSISRPPGPPRRPHVRAGRPNRVLTAATVSRWRVPSVVVSRPPPARARGTAIWSASHGSRAPSSSSMNLSTRRAARSARTSGFTLRSCR